MNKIITIALAVALMGATASVGFAQVAVDAETGVDAGVAIDAPLDTPDINAEAGLGVDANLSPAAGDNSYSSVTSAVSGGAMTDLGAVTPDSDIAIVLVSSLQGDADVDGLALDDALSSNADGVAALRASVDDNLAVKAKLDAAGYSVDDVVAVADNVNGSIIVYVDDRG